jgi:hypothetical protein
VINLAKLREKEIFMKKRILSFILALVLLLPAAALFGCNGFGLPTRVKADRLLEVMEGVFRSAYYRIPTLASGNPSQGNPGGNGGGDGGQQNGGQSGSSGTNPFNPGVGDGGQSDKNPYNPGGDGGILDKDPSADGGQQGDKHPYNPDDNKGENGGKLEVSPDKQKEYNASRSSADYLAALSAVVDAYLGVNGGVPLTEDNKKALSGEALSEGSPFAGMLRAMIEVYGDAVFTTNYTAQNTTYVVSGEGDSYTVRGVIYDEDGFRSAITMTFTKDGERYSYVFAQYSVSDHPSSPLSTLSVATYDSEAGMLRAELRAKSADIFSDYDRAYDAFEVNEFTGACFAMDNYAAYSYFEASDAQVKSLLDFARDTLGFTNATFAELAAIQPGKEITGAEAAKLTEIMRQSIYVSPYYYETNETYVRDSYTVPESVTVIETASIPAARRIYIHGNVTKIESKPFQAPQYVEEIVFLDEASGKLTEIGSFDANLGHPSFLLSMTKVKNFTLPASVKKLELGEYVLNTEVECIDLSAYDPEWLDDPSLMTCTYDEFTKIDQLRADFKESAYVNLTLCGTESFFFREVRYIKELRMPQFNMGIAFKTDTHLNIISEKYGEYYAEAFEDVYKAFYAFTGDEGSFARFDEFVAMRNYTRTYESIGRLVYHENTAIVTDEMLFSEFGGDEESGGKENGGEEKEDEKYKDDKGEIHAEHKLFELTFYRDTRETGHSPDMNIVPFCTYATVKTIVIPASLYDDLAAEEERQYSNLHIYEDMDEVIRVVVEVK